MKKALIFQFLGTNHSWAIVGHGQARGLMANGVDVDLFSTDGINKLPADLLPHCIGYYDSAGKLFGRMPRKEYDMQLSYTAMRNWQQYFQYTKEPKNRFATWCYEWSGKNMLPAGWAKMHQYVDWICAPSNYARQIFIDSGVPAEKVIVVPHGIEVDRYRDGIATIDLSKGKLV